MDSPLAKTPKPPYYAVIFSSLRTDVDAGYGAAAKRMVELASQQPGYLGIDSVRDASGVGITVSYWTDEAAIAAWKRNAEHTIMREQGRSTWYREYELRVAKIERAYGFKR
ncbi:MAG TPA: antibiotic biosynthesis monooxygenase [Burkholderiales bacterium]|nr:antibiotic biosynthesis monooxygenase [Burkholderiales bacterium]